MYISTTLQLFAVGLLASVGAHPAALDSKGTVAARGDTNVNDVYSYNKLPTGITLVNNSRSVGFLQNTTGKPTLQAPQPDDDVPSDAAHYQPSAPIMNMTEFRLWHDNVKSSNLGGSKKWMKVDAGTYEFSKETGFSLDWNNNMAFSDFTGWTLDLRGCTSAAAPSWRRASTVTRITLTGGSTSTTATTSPSSGAPSGWTRVSSSSHRPRVVTVTPSPGGGDAGHMTATLQVDDGYNVSTWGNDHAPGDFNCMDYFQPRPLLSPEWQLLVSGENTINRRQSSPSRLLFSRRHQARPNAHHPQLPQQRCFRQHGSATAACTSEA